MPRNKNSATPKLQPATVLSALAVFISLSGTGYAVTSIPANSVGTAQLRDNSVSRDKIRDQVVTNRKLRDNAITSSKLRNGTIKTQDINGSLYESLLGEQGPLGPQGLPGVGGAPGSSGATGPAGLAGVDGRTVLNGSGAPSSGAGSAGDFYIDTAASAIYGPKVGNSWGSAVSLIGPVGPQGGQGPAGPGVTPYYGSFFSTTSQNVSPADQAIQMNMDSTDLSSGVTLEAPGTLRVTNAGIYDFQFSAQLGKTGAGIDTMDIWPRVNGANVPDSDTQLTLSSATDKSVAAWNFVLAMPANSTFQLWMSSSDGTFQVLRIPEATDPVRPAVPGLILTATRVG